MNNRKYCVYMHKNNSTGKVYIGATCMKPECRWQKGKGYDYNKDFYKDILEYGWDNFEHKILAEGLDKEQSKKIERYCIGLCKNNCYNKTRGGEQGKTKYNTQEEYLQGIKDSLQKYYYKNRSKIIEQISTRQKENRLEYNTYKKDYYYKNEKYHQYKIQYQREYRRRKRLEKIELRTD